MSFVLKPVNETIIYRLGIIDILQIILPDQVLGPRIRSNKFIIQQQKYNQNMGKRLAQTSNEVIYLLINNEMMIIVTNDYGIAYQNHIKLLLHTTGMTSIKSITSVDKSEEM